MSDNKKKASSTQSNPAKSAVDKEMANFLRLKEKELERSRLRALEAMILLEQRKRGAKTRADVDDPVNANMSDTEEVLPTPIVIADVSSHYYPDGKIKFSEAESKKVKKLREYKAKRINTFLKKQNGQGGDVGGPEGAIADSGICGCDKRTGLYLNQNFPFVLKGENGRESPIGHAQEDLSHHD